MKDFYDVWVLSLAYEFDGDRLARAIAATFERRGTAVPVEAPEAFSAAFANDAAKQRQWQAFVRDLGIEVPSVGEVVTALAGFLLPHMRRASTLVARSSSDRDAP